MNPWVCEIKWLGRLTIFLFVVNKGSHKKFICISLNFTLVRDVNNKSPTPTHYNSKKRGGVIEFCFLENELLPSASV